MSCNIEDKLPYMYRWKEFTLGINIISLYRLKHEAIYKSQEINHPLVKVWGYSRSRRFGSGPTPMTSSQRRRDASLLHYFPWPSFITHTFRDCGSFPSLLVAFLSLLGFSQIIIVVYRLSTDFLRMGVVCSLFEIGYSTLELFEMCPI
jgi:hypothetical protein